jgi:dihydroorotate dehydrogenase
MGGVYRLLRPLLFRLEPETAHALAFGAAGVAAGSPAILSWIGRAGRLDDPRLAVRACGVRFPTPIGVAAGLDKDASVLPLWAALGFGHVEVGTVTARPQPGNPRPRVVRLPPDRAIVNAMGFPSVGAEALAARLRGWRRRGLWPDGPVVINVGKTRAVPLERAVDDYRASMRALADVADMWTLNVSSPNTPGLRGLQDPDRLAELVTAVVASAAGTPVLVKVAPDLSDRALVELAGTCEACGAAGLVAVNTTVRRAGLRTDPGAPGGLSGPPLAPRARSVLRVLRGATALPIVSVGGIATAREAIARFEAGADLVQLYTGLIYEGPLLARRILEGVRDELDRRGLGGVHELRRAEARGA